MDYFERKIIGWLALFVGLYFLARSGGSKREKTAMKELLGVRIDKVKFFRNFFIQRLESIVGFCFCLIGIGIHLYVLVRESQVATSQNDAQGAIRDAASYLAVAVAAMVLITAAMHAVCSYFSRRIFLDILAYLMVRYDYRLEEDTPLLRQIGEILGVERREDDTVEAYTRRIEEALKLEEIERRLESRGKLPERSDRKRRD